MSNKGSIKTCLVLVLFGLFMVSLAACYRAQASTDTVEVPKTVLVTPFITPVVYTPTPYPTHTPFPSPPPTLPPTPSPTYDPLSAPIYYPLEDCVASRLRVGDIAMVSFVGGPNGIRYGRDLQEDTIVEYADPGTLLTIVDGPWCSHGWIVWQVQTPSGYIGFTPEGNGDEYWLLPTPP